MSRLKIGVIGGGSTYTPELVDGFIKRAKELSVSKFFLMDIDERKLNIVGDLAKRMINKAKMDTEIILTTERVEAIANSDFIISQIRVGGLKARSKDEKIPLEFNVIGQETTGPGGFANALRTIPVALDIANEIEKNAPNAFLINFTNPSGIITEAINKYSNVKVIGLCNVPITMKHEIVKILEVDINSIKLDYFGLNHLSWIRKVFINDNELIDDLLNKTEKITGFNFDQNLINALHMIPSGYLGYFYHKDRVLLEQKNKNKTRAEEVLEIEEELLKLYQDPNLTEKPKILEKRGGAWYSDAAVALINAIQNDKNEIHIVNIPNQGTLNGLDSNSVVEIPALINKSGAHPIKIDRIPNTVKGLIQLVKTYEELTVEAAVEGSYNKALLALVLNPLVPNAEIAQKLLNKILKVNKKYLPRFKK